MQKEYPDSSTVGYVYDHNSRLTQVSDATGTYDFAYDNLGRLTGTETAYSFLTSRNFTVSYAYDKSSNRTGLTDPEGGTTAYAHDDADRLTSVTDAASSVTSYAYDMENNSGFGSPETGPRQYHPTPTRAPAGAPSFGNFKRDKLQAKKASRREGPSTVLANTKAGSGPDDVAAE